jgi:hypothetical protein
VCNDPHNWLTGANDEVSQRNTNAIHWLDRFERNPRPQRVIWDLTTRPHRRGEILDSKRDGGQHYWIDIGNNTAETLGVDTIIAAFEKETNSIKVEKFGNFLRLLVDGQMLDLDQLVEIWVDGEVKKVLVRPSCDTQRKTVEQRGDARYIFSGSITFIRMEHGWDVTSP